MNKFLCIVYSIIFIVAPYIMYAQNVGINTTGSNADASSMLDVNATDKGILIPRVSLVNIANFTSPVNAPAAGLLVYNTNAAVVGGYGEGFYYWSGSVWTKMATGNSLTATLSDGRIWVGNGSNVPTERLMSGDVAINNTGVATIQADAVTNAKQADMAANTVKVNNTASASNPTDMTIGTNTVLGRQAGNIVASQVATAQIADNAVDGTKISIASTSHGDLMFYNGTDWVRLPATGSGNILRTNGPGADPTWTTVNALMGSGVQNYVAKWTNAGGTQLTSSQVFDNGTNVGIGVSPSHKLDVQSGNIRASAQNTMIGAHPSYGTYSSWWREGSDYSILTEGTNLFLNAPLAAGNIYMRTANSDKLFIRGSDGFVGIGNTGPAQRLDVSGSVRATGNYYSNNTSPTIYLQDTDNRSGMIHMNSNLLYFLNGDANNSTNWAQIGGYWPLTIDMTNDIFTFGGQASFMEGNVGIAAVSPAVPLSVGGNGTNVYNTSAWVENNIHVQGNEALTQGGRGRMRVGTAWNYVGLYAEASSTAVNNDLVLGASSNLVRVGPNGGGQNLKVSGLEGTGNNRIVTTNSNGQLGSGIQMLYGSIDADGYIRNHGYTCTTCGFSITVLGGGRYRITFTNAFTGTPTVSITQHYPAAGNQWFSDVGNGGSTLDNGLTVAVTATYADIKVGDGGGTGTNRSFGFIVVGPR